jgi:hypothetical protein
MVSSLPQRQEHLRVKYRALLESAWDRPAMGTGGTEVDRSSTEIQETQTSQPPLRRRSSLVSGEVSKA